MRRSSSRGIDVERDARDAVDAELDRRDAAVERRPVVLHAGRHADRLALDVHRDLQQIARRRTTRRSTAPARRRRRWSAPTIRRCRRRPATRRAWSASRSRAGSGGRAAPGAAARSARDSSDQCAARTWRFGVDRTQLDRAVGRAARRDVRAQADGGVQRRRAVVKEIERPDVDGAAGQIDAGGRRRRRCTHGELYRVRI